MDYRKFITKKYSSKYDLSKVASLQDLIIELPILVLGNKIREYEDIDIRVKCVENNFIFILQCKKPTRELDEQILVFNALGCETLGYNHEVSKLWRTILEQTFGKEYRAWTQEKLEKIRTKEQGQSL